ncbi:MAG TPA: cupin domain-containing protein, partial [Sphingobacteriaceae bacterium]
KPSLKPFYLPPDAAPLDHEGDVAIRVKVRSSQTNLQYSCVDVAVAPRTMGPAPHLHDALDELMYVHEGTMHVLVGKEVYEVKAGGWHFRPRGIVHTFWNASNDVTRCTDMYFNQNFEDFLEELFFKIKPEMKSKNLSPMDPVIAQRLAVLDKKFGMKHFPEQRQAIVEKYGLKR